MKELIIIGAGGLAREVYDLALDVLDKREFRIKGFLSDGPSNIQDLGYPPVLETVANYIPKKTDVFLCAIGNVKDRKKTTSIILNNGGKFINLIHPTAIVSKSAVIGDGVIIKAFCVIDSDVNIGDFCYLQSSVIIGHDSKIGPFGQLNSFVFIAGNIEVGELCSLNAGARLIQGIKIGDEGVVGMGSVVIRSVKPRTTVFGNPAKLLKF